MSDDDLTVPIDVARGWAERSTFWVEKSEPIYNLAEPDLTSAIRMIAPTRVKMMRLTLARYDDDGDVERQTITVPGYVVYADPPLLLAAFPLIERQEPT